MVTAGFLQHLGGAKVETENEAASFDGSVCRRYTEGGGCLAEGSFFQSVVILHTECSHFSL